MASRSKFGLAVGAVLLPGAALAQVTPEATPPATQIAATDAAPTDEHGLPSSDIIVTAPYSRDRFGVLSSVSVLDGTVLTRQLRSTIGETLAQQPGVSSTSFGPNASRPILRGFQGERIRVLTDGIGSFDVSNTSVDHAVAVNPMLVDRIEVLHGPTSLLYGSSAIGGVVNMVGNRIPRQVPDEPVHIDALGTLGSAANEVSGSAAVNVAVTPTIVAHADASYYTAQDLKIGGYVLSPQARAEALANGADEVANLKGTLPNSFGTNWEVAGGLSTINEWGTAGLSISHYDNTYAVPVRYSLEPGGEQEAVKLAMRQNRVDALANVDGNGGFIDQIKLRWGYADYQHSEINVVTGDIGTTFYSKAQEGRLEIAQANRDGWKGAFGAQYLIRDMNIIGDEAFVPKNSTMSGGLFLLQEKSFGAVKAEVGARYEVSTVDSQVANFSRTFKPLSGSIGFSTPLATGWRIGIDLSHTERAPAAEELLANGPHAGTQAYEIGNRDLKIEAANGAELVVRGSGSGYSFEASLYYDRFSNYIYDSNTGDFTGGLPVFVTRQAAATYYGFEVQGNVTLTSFGAWTLSANALADFVHAELDNIGPVPRIPPLRVLGGLGLAGPSIDATLQVEWAAAQNRVAPYETTTDSYTMVNFSINWSPFKDNPNTYFVLSANNLFNVDARRAASFLKDFAPLAGRDFRLALRVAI